ncbi:MAG: FHA domain-containing protein [Chloroflexota bacterium]
MKFSKAIGLVLIGLLFQLQVNAQSASLAFLSSPDTKDFPTVSAFLDVRDSQGNFLPELTTDKIMIVEDGIQLPASGIGSVENGLQFVLAVNTATSFAIIDQQGIKRYDYISEYLRSWAERSGDSTGDDLSITTPSGVNLIHQADYKKWLVDFESFQPNFQTAVPSLTSLEKGIDIASETGTVLGASRAILWLTPSLNQSYNADLQALEQRARLAGVRVFIWMIDSQALFKTEQAFTLQAFADQTGGQFYVFSGIEAIPDLDAMLDSTRKMHLISYQSQVTTAGSHELSVSVQLDTSVVSTVPQTFNLELASPNVNLIEFPTQFSRTLADDSQGAAGLEPATYDVNISIEFPDNLPRKIVGSSLLVNGNIIAINKKAPFEKFSWDITQFTKSEQVNISVQVEDELGIIGVSPEYPLKITVQGVPQGFQALFARFGSLLVIGIVLVAAIVLLLVLLLSGRLQPKPLGSRRLTKPRYEDPVTQPISDPTPTERKTEPSKILMRVAKIFSNENSRRNSNLYESDQIAYLLPFIESGSRANPGTEKISLPAHEITLGSDKDQSNIPINEPGVEPLHARLWRDEVGNFQLADENSIAGTWINYAPVSQNGSLVEHGDLIHIGRAGFRFNLHNPPKIREPLITQDNHQSNP